jgi:hypothetical protein
MAIPNRRHRHEGTKRARGLWVWQPTEFKTGLTESLESLATWCSSKAAPIGGLFHVRLGIA